MKDKEKLTYCGLSDMGRQRTNNEDAFVAEQLDENAILAVAIDGVGGYEGGEVAAEIAQTEIPKYLHEFKNGERIELLKQAVISANNAIYDRRQLDPARSNMSCVLTSAIVDKGRKVVDMVHVGDTRMYQYRHGELRKLSHDHSLIGYREEVGDLTEEQAMHHPQRNVISRDVGSAKHEVEDRDFLEAEEFPLLPNSIFLLCSDGLTDLITSKQIVSILEQQTSLQKKAQALVDAANEAGGKDNITVVLVEYQAEEIQVEVKEEQTTTKEVTTEKTQPSEKPPLKTECSKSKRRIVVIIIVIILFALGMTFYKLCSSRNCQNNNKDKEFDDVLQELYEEEARQSETGVEPSYIPDTDWMDLNCTPDERKKNCEEHRNCSYYEKEFFHDSISTDIDEKNRNAGQAFRISVETSREDGNVSLIFTKYIWEVLDGDSILHQDYGFYTIQHRIDDVNSMKWIMDYCGNSKNGQQVVDYLFDKYGSYGYSSYWYIIHWLVEQEYQKNIKVRTNEWLSPKYIYMQ